MSDPNRPWRRRELGALAAGTLAAGALPRRAVAQPRGAEPSGAVLPVPVPCATGRGDVVGLVLEGSGAPAGTVVVFGQAFLPGALPRNAQLAARQAGGQALRAQLDVKTRHPDGSARFGVVSLAAPALRPGERRGVVLAVRAGDAEAPLDLAAALAGRRAVLDILPAGGAPWQADLFALLRDALARRTASPWQSGPLAAQARFALPVPPAAVGGATSARLVADIAARADGTVWVDCWIRNDIVMRPGGGPAAYGLRLQLDGRDALRAEAVNHEQYAGWGRLLGAAPGGRPAPTPPLVRADVAALGATGAVAHYDLSVGVDERLLARLAQAVAAPAWAVPLGARELVQYMPTSGGRADIGPTTQAQAIWLLTGDPRAAAYCLGQAEASGAIPWHFWDPGGGADNGGGWMDTRHWPRFMVSDRNGPPPRSMLQQPSRQTWSPDLPHQPDLCYVPFLLTGRRAFLDGLQAQSVAQVLSGWAAMRTASDVVIVQRTQIRGAAWGLRQVDEAAWMSPDDDPNTDYLRHVARENWRWLVAQIPALTAMQGEAHGWLDPGSYDRYGGGVASWQQDYLATTVIASASRGNEDAVTFLNWQANYLVGRFLNDARGFNYRDGVAYNMIVIDPPTKRYLATWAEIGRAMVDRGLSNGDGWSKGTAGAAMATLAGIVSLGGPAAAAARRAYDRLVSTGGPSVQVEALQRNPIYVVAPRGLPRVPARAPRCAAIAPG
ncbi:hypothetical protein [Roseomonas sp. BN140053]|uniref:hypothetical protein n=1 Tax=Roseomonas sp. BN140053 TaxID=3391898 RepID=UPI0039E7EC04